MEEDPFQSPKSTVAPPGPVQPPKTGGKLWLCLFAPPFSVGLATIIGMGMTSDLGPLLTVIPLAVSIWSLVEFIRIVAARYRNPSLTLLILGYLFGELIVCGAAFFGACLLSLNGNF